MTLASSLRKTVAKYSSSTVHMDFHDRDEWIGCGNYAMNKLFSGSYKKAINYGKTTCLGGKSGSGKSLVAATVSREAQRDGAFVVWIDSEHASKEKWLNDLGVKTGEEDLLYLEVSTIVEVKKIIADLVEITNKTKPEDRQKVVVVIDSYSALMTESQQKNTDSGDQTFDQGLQSKGLKDLVKSVGHQITRLPIAVLGMVHTMPSRDQYNPDDILTGGRGVEYFASLVIVFDKFKLKGKDAGDDGSLSDEYDDEKRVVGIKCKCQVYKSRASKPNENIFVQILWPNGLDKFSGLFDYLKDSDTITSPSVGWYQFEHPALSEPLKFRKKGFRDYAEQIIELLERDIDANGPALLPDDVRTDVPVPDDDQEAV